MDVIRDCGWLYTGMIIVCGGLFFVNNLLETYFSSCMFFSALWLSVQWCYCRSWPVISHWRCWSWCWWDRSWWCTSTTLRLSGGTSLAGREMLSVEHSLFYPQSVPTGTWHCQVGQTHPLVSGWETNWGNKFNVSSLSSVKLGLDILCIVQGEIWQAMGCSPLCNSRKTTRHHTPRVLHVLLCSWSADSSLRINHDGFFRDMILQITNLDLSNTKWI